MQRFDISWSSCGERCRGTNSDRWLLIQLYRWFPSVLKVITVIRPETLVRWHPYRAAIVGSRLSFDNVRHRCAAADCIGYDDFK